MTYERKTGIALAVLGLAAVTSFAAAYFLNWDTYRTGQHESPNTGRAERAQVSVAPGKLVMPSRAGEPATVHLSATNNSATVVYIRRARLVGGPDGRLVDLDNVANEDISHLSIGPGETLKTAPPAEQTILTAYGPSVVPGAQVKLELTFSDGTTTLVPLTVETMVGQDGRIRSPEDV